MAMTVVIFITATNLLISFLGVSTKSTRTQDIEQAKNDIMRDLTNAATWASKISFSGGILSIDADKYKVVDGRFLKNDVFLTSQKVNITNFDVKRLTSRQEPGDGAQTGTGIMGSYYSNQDFTNLVFIQRDPEIDFDWGPGSPRNTIDKDTFSVRWVGQLYIPRAGRYTFYTRSDDGVRLWVSDSPLIENWVPHSVTENRAEIDLPGNVKVPIQLDYYEQTYSSTIRLSWSGPGITKSVVSSEYLYPEQSITSLDVSMNLVHTESSSIQDNFSFIVSPRQASVEGIISGTPRPTFAPTLPPSGSPNPTASPPASGTSNPTATPKPLR